MAQRLYNVGSAVSAAFAACTLLLWLATVAVTPWDHRLSFGHGFHVAVWSGVSGDKLGRLVFFNDADYGPYRGSVIQIVDEKGELHPKLDRSIEWGDSFGIYYRYFRWPDGHTLWTLMMSLWYPLFLFSILPIAWILRRWYSRGKNHVVNMTS
jgi:hypothetical protein